MTAVLIDYFSFFTINDSKIMPLIKFKHFRVRYVLLDLL